MLLRQQRAAGSRPSAGSRRPFFGLPSSSTRRGLRRPVVAHAAMQLKDVIEKLISREDLSVQQAEESFEAMLSDFVPEQVAAFLVLLRAKVGRPGPRAGRCRHRALLERPASGAAAAHAAAPKGQPRRR
jgi:hypothetical protein